QEKVKLAVFSGHDTTIAPLLSSLGLFNGELTKWPGFGRNGVQSSPSYDNHYVRMKYNGEKLILPQCQKQSFWKKSTPANYRGDPTLCRLDIFMNAIGNIIPEAYEADCK
ncbi:phosphoglycerate mutase-like protein, partial [Rhizoclosmatium globosum]